MKIHLRKRKQSNHEKINLFLEFYKVYEKEKGANFIWQNILIKRLI